MTQGPSCTVNYLCIGALLVFLGSILLIALGFTVILPYEATRSWPEATCRVLNASYNPQLCTCQRQLTDYEPCNTKYPCLQVYVLYSRMVLVYNDSYNTTDLPADVSQQQVDDVVTGHHQELTTHVVYAANTDNQAHATSDKNVPLKAAEHTAFVKYHSATGTVSDENQTLAPSDFNLNMNTSVLLDNSLTVPLTEHQEISNSQPRPSTSSGNNGKSTVFDHRPLSTISETIAPKTYSIVESAPVSSKISASPPDHVNSTTDSPYYEKEEILTGMLFRSWGDAFYNQCSLQECGDEEWNLKESSRFRAEWGKQGMTFPCFYDPTRLSKVIVQRTSETAMLHAVLWSCMCLGCGALLWIGLCLGCCSLGPKGYEQEAEDKKSYGLLPT